MTEINPPAANPPALDSKTITQRVRDWTRYIIAHLESTCGPPVHRDNANEVLCQVTMRDGVTVWFGATNCGAWLPRASRLNAKDLAKLLPRPPGSTPKFLQIPSHHEALDAQGKDFLVLPKGVKLEVFFPGIAIPEVVTDPPRAP